MRAFTGARGPGRAMGGGERPVIVQKHFHAFHASIHPAWPDGSRHLITGSEVAGKPGSDNRIEARPGEPAWLPAVMAGEPNYRRVTLR